MIKFIDIKNFRSYEEAHVEFHPGLNVIIGDNDAGKSNIIRGIDLVANNRPTGDEYRSTWGGDTIVCLGVDRKEICRIRDKDNLYVVKHEDGTRNEFKAFGTSVPEFIKSILNMSSVNIHFQMEGPFLLSQSPVDVGRYFNNIVNLDIIDLSISNIAKILRNENREYGAQEDKILDLESQLLKYSWLDDAEESLKKLNKIEESIYDIKSDISILNESISEWERKENEWKEIKNIIRFETKVKNLLSLYKKIQEEKQEASDLYYLQKSISILEKEEKTYSEIIKFDLAVKDLIELDKRIDIAIDEYNELDTIINRIESLTKEKEKIDKKLEELVKEQEKLMPDICPLCGRNCDCPRKKV